MLDFKSPIQGLLRNFGLKVGVVSRAQYERRILELIEDLPSLSAIIEPMLAVRRVVREQYVPCTRGCWRWHAPTGIAFCS